MNTITKIPNWILLLITWEIWQRRTHHGHQKQQQKKTQQAHLSIQRCHLPSPLVGPANSSSPIEPRRHRPAEKIGGRWLWRSKFGFWLLQLGHLIGWRWTWKSGSPWTWWGGTSVIVGLTKPCFFHLAVLPALLLDWVEGPSRERVRFSENQQEKWVRELIWILKDKRVKLHL